MAKKTLNGLRFMQKSYITPPPPLTGGGQGVGEGVHHFD
jgi:hypothetical protein